MTEGLDVFIDGTPLSTICTYSGLGWTTRFPYGDWDITFSIGDGNGWRHPAFKRGANVEVRYGGGRTVRCEMAEPDWDSGQIAATGLIRRAEDYRARVWDSDLLAMVPTWNLRAAVDDAITPNGASGRVAIGWDRDSTVPDRDLRPGSGDDETLTLMALLDLATQRGYGSPYMGPDGVLTMLLGPVTAGTLLAPQPKWYVHPNVVDVGETGGDDRATLVYVTYLAASALSWLEASSYTTDDVVIFRGTLWKANATTDNPPYDGSLDWTSLGAPDGWDEDTDYDNGAYVVFDGSVYHASGDPALGLTPPTPPWALVGTLPIPTSFSVADSSVTPFREDEVDATDLGDMTGAEATDIADQALAEGLQPSFATDVTATPMTVADINGMPCDPLAPRAGDLVRVWGAAHPHLSTPFIDVTLGEYAVADADTDNPVGTMKFVGKQARTFPEVLEAALNTRRAA